MAKRNERTVQRDETCIDGRDGSQLIRLAGVSFRPGYPDNLLNLGDKYPDGEIIPVTLEREPDNKYDVNAIKVLIGEEFIGYIPKALNPPIQEAMDRGEAFTCRVEEVLVLPSKPRQPGIIIHVKKALDVPALGGPSGGQ